ncbi:MAG: peptidoglycan-binding protein [Ruminococcus sp.]
MAYTNEDRRNHIRELQRYLYSLSFYDETMPQVVPDGIYGRETALAVRAFQQKNGLRPNGETNRATWDAIVAQYRKQIGQPPAKLSVFGTNREILGGGETGFSVLVLQSILKTLRLRYPNTGELQLTGIYDAATQRAVQVFQNLTGHKPTGMVDRATWNLLVAAIESETN